MKLVPLLALQRGIYEIPISQRFQGYLDTMLLENRQDIRYPWSHVNPMAKPHISDLLDQLMDQQIEDEIQKSSSLLQEDADPHPAVSVGLVVVDDILGGWTDRIDVEFQNSFAQVEPLWKRGWVEVLIWASDYCDLSKDGSVQVPPLEEDESKSHKQLLLESTERSIYRSLYQHRQREQGQINQNDSIIQTLGDMMDQESWVQEQLLQHHATLEEETGAATDAESSKDIQQARNILREYKSATIDESYPTVIAAYYGDEAAEKCGYPTLGMKAWSGQQICCASRGET